jgi:hypothetical protein
VLPGSLGQFPGSLGMVPGSLGMVPGSLGMVPGSLGQLPGSLGYLSGRGGIPLVIRGGPAPEPGEPRHGNPDGQHAAPGPDNGIIQAEIELVICGRSVPGSALTVAGRSIPTGPDGAFSLRITVPEGTREVPIEAQLQGSEDRSRINLRFGRETE